MRVVLNSDVCGKFYPNGCYSDQDVLDLFDSLEEVNDESLIKEEQETNVVKYKNNLFYTYNSRLCSMKIYKHLKIVDVDTNKLWTVDKRNDVEFIIYYQIGENNQLEEIK